jgi:hypothetical protein
VVKLLKKEYRHNRLYRAVLGDLLVFCTPHTGDIRHLLNIINMFLCSVKTNASPIPSLVYYGNCKDFFFKYIDEIDDIIRKKEIYSKPVIKKDTNWNYIPIATFYSYYAYKHICRHIKKQIKKSLKRHE